MTYSISKIVGRFSQSELFYQLQMAAYCGGCHLEVPFQPRTSAQMTALVDCIYSGGMQASWTQEWLTRFY